MVKGENVLHHVIREGRIVREVEMSGSLFNNIKNGISDIRTLNNGVPVKSG